MEFLRQGCGKGSVRIEKESEMKMFLAVLAVVVSFALAASLPIFVYGQLAEAESTTRNGFGFLSIIGAVFVFVGCLRFCVTGSPFKTIAPPHEDKK